MHMTTKEKEAFIIMIANLGFSMEDHNKLGIRVPNEIMCNFPWYKGWKYESPSGNTTSVNWYIEGTYTNKEGIAKPMWYCDVKTTDNTGHILGNLDHIEAGNPGDVVSAIREQIQFFQPQLKKYATYPHLVSKPTKQIMSFNVNF